LRLAFYGSDYDSVLKHTTKLKIISKYGVGLDKLDLESLKKQRHLLRVDRGHQQNDLF
jgi:lactate dehydrogenase-like 2-hydroxyacid dehydrogenase